MSLRTGVSRSVQGNIITDFLQVHVYHDGRYQAIPGTVFLVSFFEKKDRLVARIMLFNSVSIISKEVMR